MCSMGAEGQVEKQDTSGNERERECESETVDYGTPKWTKLIFLNITGIMPIVDDSMVDRRYRWSIVDDSMVDRRYRLSIVDDRSPMSMVELR